MKKRFWYQLDNVGKFYALTSNSKIPAVFRYSVTLTEKVEEKVLQKALDKTLLQFPNFHATLRRGLFWYYLEKASQKVIVTKEELPICTRIYKDSDNVLFRVHYYDYRINLEVSHILSDGRGSLKFFKTLITNYLIMKYHLKDVHIEDSASNFEKSEDGFNKYYNKNKASENKTKNVYRYDEKKRKNPTFMEYHISTEAVLNLAHQYDSSLTGLLIAVLICAYRKEMKTIELGKTIKIDVPVDLRRFFKTETIRNFFGIVSVSYTFSNRNESFEKVIASVNKQLKSSVQINRLSTRMNKMISLEKNVFVRISPLTLKNLVLKMVNKITSSQCTSSLSNLGEIKVEKPLEKYIKDFNALNAGGTFKMTICSYKNDLSIGVVHRYENNNLMKNFCHFFSEHDIFGKLNINWGEDDEEV